MEEKQTIQEQMKELEHEQSKNKLSSSNDSWSHPSSSQKLEASSGQSRESSSAIQRGSESKAHCPLLGLSQFHSLTNQLVLLID